MATIMASEDSVFVTLEKKDYLNVLAEKQQTILNLKMQELSRISGFEGINVRGLRMV